MKVDVKKFFSKKLIQIIFIIVCIILIYFFYTCPFVFLFGIPCPGCGLTRACTSAVKLHFGDAFYYHPLFFFVFLIAGYFVLERFKKLQLSAKRKKMILILVALLFIVTYILRMVVLKSPVLEIDLKKSIFYKFYTFLEELK